MEKSKNYKDLLVWQKAIDLTEFTYKVTSKFPKEEIYGISSQMRRCSISIPSNIAEGQARGSLPQFIHFLNIAKGSMAELDTQIIIAKRLGYIDEVDQNMFETVKSDTAKLLHGLINSLQKQG